MAPKRKNDQTSVTLPANALLMLDQAMETGLFGSTRGEVMRAMILDQLRRLLAEGLISLPKN